MDSRRRLLGPTTRRLLWPIALSGAAIIYAGVSWFVHDGHALRWRDGRPRIVRVDPILRQAVGLLVVSDDGEKIVGGTNDGELLAWDGGSLTPTARCRPFRGAVTALAFCADGQLVAGSQEGELASWDFITEPARIHSPHESPIRTLAGAPRGNRWVSTDITGEVRVWAARGELLQAFSGHTGSVRDVSFAPHGNWLATGAEDATGRLWDLGTGACLATFRGHLTHVCDIRVAPDSATVATGSYDGFAILWDPATGEPRHKLAHEYRVEQLAYAPDSARLATGTGDFWAPEPGIVRVWDVATGELLRETPLPDGGYVTALRYDQDEIVAQSSTGQVHSWDAATGEPLEIPGAALRMAHPELMVLPFPGDRPEVRAAAGGRTFRLQLGE